MTVSVSGRLVGRRDGASPCRRHVEATRRQRRRGQPSGRRRRDRLSLCRRSKPDGYALVWNSNSISTTFHAGTLAFNYEAFEPVAQVLVESPMRRGARRFKMADAGRSRRRRESEPEDDHRSEIPAPAATPIFRPWRCSGRRRRGRRRAVRRRAGDHRIARRPGRRGRAIARGAVRARQKRKRPAARRHDPEPRSRLPGCADRARARATTSRSKPGAASPCPKARRSQ